MELVVLEIVESEEPAIFADAVDNPGGKLTRVEFFSALPGDVCEDRGKFGIGNSVTKPRRPLSALARELGESKATVLRMLRTLEELRWVGQAPVPASTWSLDFHAYAVTAQAESGGSLRDAALGPMNDLQLQTSETIHLCVPDGRELIVVERLDTAHALRAFVALGTRVPLHASGTGLAYLAACDASFVDEYLERQLIPSTVHSLTDATAIREELDSVKERGYSINEGGLSEGITSLGAAIVGADGRALGSVSISGPSSRIVPSLFKSYGPVVRATAAAIGRRTRA